MKFEHLVKICFWLNLAVKGLKNKIEIQPFAGQRKRLDFNFLFFETAV